MLILLIICLFLNVILILFSIVQIMFYRKQIEVNDFLIDKIKEYDSFREQDKRDKMIIRECLKSGGLYG